MIDKRIFEAEISAFFHKYLTFPQEDYSAQGTLTKQAIKDAANMLLSEKVFTSKSEMKAEALDDYGVILPEEIFSDQELIHEK